MIRAAPRRFRPEALFRPRSIAVLGSASAAGRLLLRNLREGGFAGAVHEFEHRADLEDFGAAVDLGVVAGSPEELQPGLDLFARLGTGVAIATTPGAWTGAACHVLGPGAFGVIVPAAGLNASLAHLQARAGKLALISPSAALCRTVLDWAGPNGVGFSHVVGTGAELDVDAAVILDVLAREPATGAILLDIRTIRDRRAFLSAARAAARLRPVVALHAGSRQQDPSGRGERVFQAALRRAGILHVATLAEFLAAAETLTRARPPRTDRLMIVTNAIGAGQLAADQAVRLGLDLTTLDPAAQTMLGLQLPPQPPDPGIVWTGDDHPTRLAEAVAMLSALPEVGGVVVVVAPTGEADAAAAAALVAAQPGLKLPMLACILGETTAALHRRTLAEAGIPVFASPEQAVRGFAQLVQQRQARAAARELPSSRVLRLAPAVPRHNVSWPRPGSTAGARCSRTKRSMCSRRTASRYCRAGPWSAPKKPLPPPACLAFPPSSSSAGSTREPSAASCSTSPTPRRCGSPPTACWRPMACSFSARPSAASASASPWRTTSCSVPPSPSDPAAATGSRTPPPSCRR